MPELSKQFEYQMLREESRAEHALIANRLAWYVTSQSFLVTAFAISEGNGFRWFHWFSTVLLPLLGFGSSALVFPSIVGACETLRLWRAKQYDFLMDDVDFRNAFELQRPAWIEARGLLFPKVMPMLFGSFWIVIFAFSYLQ